MAASNSKQPTLSFAKVVSGGGASNQQQIGSEVPPDPVPNHPKADESPIQSREPAIQTSDKNNWPSLNESSNFNVDDGIEAQNKNKKPGSPSSVLSKTGTTSGSECHNENQVNLLLIIRYSSVIGVWVQILKFYFLGTPRGFNFSQLLWL